MGSEATRENTKIPRLGIPRWVIDFARKKDLASLKPKESYEDRENGLVRLMVKQGRPLIHIQTR